MIGNFLFKMEQEATNPDSIVYLEGTNATLILKKRRNIFLGWTLSGYGRLRITAILSSQRWMNIATLDSNLLRKLSEIQHTLSAQLQWLRSAQGPQSPS